MNMIERLLSKIDMAADGDCWIWNGAPTSEGYGRFTFDGAQFYAHRFVWELVVGEIPPEMTLDHGEACSNRLCVNPDHLDVCTRAENTRRGAVARTSTCPSGHSYHTDNTYRTPQGHRRCRVCARDRAAVDRARYRHPQLMTSV